MTEIENYRKELATRRQNLRLLYARYRELGSKSLHKCPNLGYDREKHRYVRKYYSGESYKEGVTIKALLKLQTNIEQQAMLLLELEYSIDHEERMKNEDQLDSN